MLAYILRRILMTVPVVGVVALVVFSLLYLTPGDPAAVIAGDQATPEEVQALRVSLGLDQPFLDQFGRWSARILRGDLGISIFTNQPVTLMIGQRLVPTLSLLTFSLLVAVTAAIPFGVLAAWRHGRTLDRALSVFGMLGFSVPVFVVGYLLAYLFASTLRWFPVQGYAPPSAGIGPFLSYLTLPAFTIGISYAALIARTTRASMLEVLSQDYVRTARAKGLGSGAVLFRHGLRNASVPIVTIIGLGLVTLISGSVITENVFAIPGLGRLTLEAILHRDYPVIQAVVLLFSFAYVLINLAVDLCYTLLDPRIRY